MICSGEEHMISFGTTKETQTYEKECCNDKVSCTIIKISYYPHGKIVKNLVGILMVKLFKMADFGEISTFLDPENGKNRVFFVIISLSSLLKGFPKFKLRFLTKKRHFWHFFEIPLGIFLRKNGVKKCTFFYVTFFFFDQTHGLSGPISWSWGFGSKMVKTGLETSPLPLFFLTRSFFGYYRLYKDPLLMLG